MDQKVVRPAFVKDAGGDGLFVDQMHGFSWLRSKKKQDVEKAQVAMMRMAKAAIGPDKILLLNNAAHITALFEVGDAFMFEHYSAKLLTKEKILSDWSLMKKISDPKGWKFQREFEHASVTVDLEKREGSIVWR